LLQARQHHDDSYEALDQRSKLILRLVLVLSGLDIFLSL